MAKKKSKTVDAELEETTKEVEIVQDELDSKKDKKEKKSKSKMSLYVTILIVVVILTGLLYLVWYNKKGPSKEKVEVKVLDNLEEYGYTLSDNDSELFKTEFNALKEIVNSEVIDYEKYSEQVAKLFVIDVYTLSTKINIYDVGGIEYFYNSNEEKNVMFQQKLIDTMYATVEDNTYGDRDQELPEVKSVTVDSIEKTTFEKVDKVDDKEVKEKLDGYKIMLSWDYVKDMGYDTKAEVIVVPDGNIRYSVVSFNTDLKDKK